MAVVFSDNLKKAVKRVSDDDTVLSVFETKDWNPFGITNTTSGDLLVCLRKDDQSKVVRYSSTGTVLQEIQYDSQCQPLYQWAWNIAENIYGDVIVTDFKRNAAISVHQSGMFRYSYGGEKRASELSSVTTDRVGHVFISDFRGDKIHMLDQYGKFLRYIIPHGERIDHPRTICMLDDDELIVGEYLSDSGFPSDEKYNARLYDMAVTDDKKVWMGGQSRELKLFDLQGHLYCIVNITCSDIYISMQNKQVVFSDNLDKAVKRDSDDDTVVTMTGDHTASQAALDRLGVYRYSYGVKMRTMDDSKDIEVCSVAADSVGHVTITDFQGDKIHMLNQDGNFLRYIIPHGMEI
ncbi:uncharacterized protein LOC144622259 [Crassostrea virginica]